MSIIKRIAQKQIKPKKLTKSDLKKPLKKNLSKTQVKAELRARIQKIQQTKSLTMSKKPGKSFVARGQAGTSNALLKIKRVAQMQSKFVKNNETATRIYRIYEKMLREHIEMERVMGGEHQILVNATNKLLIAEKNKREVLLTMRERNTIEKYS